jgi:hypothetical protein
MIVGFLLGVIATLSLIASLFFFKFWVKTHDKLFLAFATFRCAPKRGQLMDLRDPLACASCNPRGDPAQELWH